MGIMMQLTKLFIDVVSPWALGYVVGQSRYSSSKLCSLLLNLNIFFFWPTIGLLSMWRIELSYSLALLPVVGAIHYFIPGLFGWFECKKLYKNPLDQGSFFLMTLLPNNITIGFISAFILFGERGIALAQIMTLCAMPINFLVAYPCGQYFGNLGGIQGLKKPILKEIVFSKNQIPTLAILFGLSLNIFDVKRPEVFTEILPILIHISAWAFLFPVGHSMKFSVMKNYWKESLAILKYKFLIAPLSVLIFSMFFFSDTVIIGTSVVIGLSPVAIFAIVISQFYRLNYHIAITGVLVSHIVFSIIIFPLLILLKDWLW